MLLVGVVEVDHLANVGQAESHPLAAQYPGQAGAVATRIDARKALPFRRDQPFILVEAQGARGDAEFLRQVGDAIGLPVAMIGQFDDRSEEHTSELQSLMRHSYAVFCWKKKNISTPFHRPNIIPCSITTYPLN